MTLQEFISNPPIGYNGVYVGSGALKGQCGSLVRQYWIDVDKTSPPSYENSVDYWFNPVPGYDRITSNPQPGDIVIYNGHGVYTSGHSAIYVGDGVVFEQNANPDASPAHLYKRANTYLLGYLRKQVQEGDTIMAGITIQGNPSICSWGPDRRDVFAKGSDGGLWHCYYEGKAGGWKLLDNWERLPGGIIGDPDAVAAGPGILDIVGAGNGGHYYHWWLQPDGSWGLEDLGIIKK